MSAAAAAMMKYDDRYDMAKYGYVVVSIENKKATSHVVKNGKVTEDTDKSVLSLADGSTSELVAVGIGTASIIIAPKGSEDDETKQLRINITVKPAVLTLMLIAGQNNASGSTAENTGSELNESIACTPGTVYSAYAAESTALAEQNGLSSAFTSGDASAYVPGDLTSNLSYTGNKLEYDVYSLTSEGKGKLGIDSGLAYTWNKLTGEKVFIVNAAWGSATVANWLEGGSAYERARALYEPAIQTYIAEVESGHYVKGSRFVFWMQGETNRGCTAAYYEKNFSAVCEKFLALGVTDDGWFKIDKIGVLSARAFTANHYGLGDIEMTGPRIAAYTMCGSPDYPYLCLVSNAGEQWVTDTGVEEYFTKTYSEGCITYPTQGKSKYSSSLPRTIAEVHNSPHYSQTGHNENGITAAEGMYAAIYGESRSGAQWRGLSGIVISSLEIAKGSDTTLICSAAHPCFSKELSYWVSDSSVISYDAKNRKLTANNTGTACIYVYADGSKAGEIEITVVSKITATGLVYDESKSRWAYYTDGAIDTSYTGAAGSEYGTYYISAGYVDWSYCGLYRKNGLTYYFYYGYASVTGLLLETDGYLYYMTDGVVDTAYTGMAVSSYGTYYVINGVADYTVSGVCEINGASYYISRNKIQMVSGFKSFDGTYYYMLGGIIQTDYTGFYLQKNGVYYYIESGICTFSTTGIVTIDGIKYYIYASRLKTGTGVTKINGTYYYIEDDGTIDYTGLVTNSSGVTYYAENGIIDISTTGIVKDADGKKYYVENSRLKSGNDITFVNNVYYYIEPDGSVGYTGLVTNKKNGIIYYAADGVIDLSYTGKITIDGVTYNIVNSRVSQ